MPVTTRRQFAALGQTTSNNLASPSRKRARGGTTRLASSDSKENVKESPRAARKKKTPSLQESKAPPPGWESIYALVEELREDRSAPVDADGGEALPEQERGTKVFRFQTLVALMLSSQTKDAIVGETMRSLQQHGLDVEHLSQTPAEKLNQLIWRVGFHNNKTKYIKETVEILRSKHGGDIPRTAEEIMTLPGVGPKMAFIVEKIAWGTISGIGVDTHMHRMFNQLGWVKSKTPEKTRVQLEAWLPRDKWGTVNVLWVGFGQEVQQFKPKMLQKALACSQPAAALRLVKRLGLDPKKEAAKLGLEEKVNEAMKTKSGDQ